MTLMGIAYISFLGQVLCQAEELGYAGLAIQLLAGVNPSEWTMS